MSGNHLKKSVHGDLFMVMDRPLIKGNNECEQHLKNIHDIGMEQYLKRIPKSSEKQTTYRDPPNQLRSCNQPRSQGFSS